MKSLQVVPRPAPESALLILTKKGSLDDHDYMTNGDDGLQYGEARQGITLTLTLTLT